MLMVYDKSTGTSEQTAIRLSACGSGSPAPVPARTARNQNAAAPTTMAPTTAMATANGCLRIDGTTNPPVGNVPAARVGGDMNGSDRRARHWVTPPDSVCPSMQRLGDASHARSVVSDCSPCRRGYPFKTARLVAAPRFLLADPENHELSSDGDIRQRRSKG